MLAAARDHKADGVICGHIYRSDHRLIDSVLYVNDGDWVRNLTAAVELRDGSLQVIRWDRLGENISIPEVALREAIS